MRSPKLLWLIALLAVLMLMPGCALINALVEYPTPTPKPQIALRPTFTPTTAPTPLPTLPPTDTPVPPPAAQQAPTATPEAVAAAAIVTPTATLEPPTPTPIPAPPTATPEPPTPQPQVVVSTPRVNVRSGPSESSSVLGQVVAGERLAIVGRDAASAWWQVCCFQGQTAWVSAEVVQAEGPLQTVALAEGLAPTAATPAPAVAAVAASPGDFAFALSEQTTFPFAQDFLRVGVKVNDANDAPLASYYLRVFNETTGQQWLSSASLGDPWRHTAASVDLPGYRQANLFFDTRAKSTLAGNRFTLWLVDGAGRPVSPTITYEQITDDLQWLYVVWTRF